MRKKLKKKIFDKLLNKGEHYYYIDKENKEWAFTEINGVANYYYFKCSTHKCKAFAKIERYPKDKNQNELILTKEHTLSYTEHTYYKKDVTIKKINERKLEEAVWEDNNIRLTIFKKFFEKNKFCSDAQCITYVKGIFGHNINIDNNIIKEIKSAKITVNLKLSEKNNILEQLSNIKDNNNISISNTFEYEYINKKKKNIYIIIGFF